MKILIPLLLLTFGANANEVVYRSVYGTTKLEERNKKIIDVAAGETIQILNVTGGYPNGSGTNGEQFSIRVHFGDLPVMSWQVWKTHDSNNHINSNGIKQEQFNVRNFKDDVMVGPCSISISPDQTGRELNFYQVSYKLTKPSVAGTTTSAPILLPPTQDAAKSWFVKLQVSSDLKAWDDVAPGQFLGSDTARFFRIQTTEAE